MVNKMGPAGYMLSQVLNRRKREDNVQIAPRAYDGKWNLWQYVFTANEDNSFTEYWQIIGVFETKAGALLAYQNM